MGASHSEQWQRLYQQKSHSFLEERCYHASGVTDLATLQASFTAMEKRYALPHFADIVRAFQPSLGNVKSFTVAISSATHDIRIPGLVWGAIQAAIESACKCPETLDEVFILLSELNNSLPHLHKESDLIPEQPNLQWPLQDLYEDYIDYCIATIRYLRKKSSLNMLRSFWASTPRQTLQTTKINIGKHGRVPNSPTQSGYELARNLQVQRPNGPSHPQRDDEASVNFPVHIGVPTRNHTFVGREDVLDNMQTQLRRSLSDPACYVLYGPDGVGKTETASEFTHLFRKDYDAVFWLPAEQVEVAYAQIAIHLGLAMDDGYGDNKKAKVQMVRKWLEQTNHRWLLIFDDIEDVDELEPFFPTSTKANSSVVLTTQMSECTPVTKNFTRFQLQSFEPADASKLLFKCLGREPENEDEEEAAKQVLKILHGLPPAIAAIGGYIQQSKFSIPEFLGNLRRSFHAWEARVIGSAKRSQKQYEKAPETVFDIALNESDSQARKLINVLAFVNPDGLPEDILTTLSKKQCLTYKAWVRVSALDMRKMQ